MDITGIEGGERWERVIERELSLCDIVLVIIVMVVNDD